MYALVEDESVDGLEFYAADCYGIGELEEYEADYVMLTPTVHCQKYGRRMLATTTTKAPERVIYRCICGEIIGDHIFDEIRESCENPEG